MRFVSSTDPSYIVLHTMVGTVDQANARFQRPSEITSAHYGVGLDGSLVQWVREEDTAWHLREKDLNARSFGIEHEDAGDYNGPRTDQLYASSSALVRDLCERYSIPTSRDYIRAHSEFSTVPTPCPAALDVDRIVREAGAMVGLPVLPTPISSMSSQGGQPQGTSVAIAVPTGLPTAGAPGGAQGATPAIGAAGVAPTIQVSAAPIASASVGPAEPGYTTTEFWGKSLIQAFSIGFAIYVAAHPGQLSPTEQAQIVALAGVVIPAALEALYGFYRSWRKRGTPG